MSRLFPSPCFPLLFLASFPMVFFVPFCWRIFPPPPDPARKSSPPIHPYRVKSSPLFFPPSLPAYLRTRSRFPLVQSFVCVSAPAVFLRPLPVPLPLPPPPRPCDALGTPYTPLNVSWLVHDPVPVSRCLVNGIAPPPPLFSSVPTPPFGSVTPPLYPPFVTVASLRSCTPPRP